MGREFFVLSGKSLDFPAEPSSMGRRLKSRKVISERRTKMSENKIPYKIYLEESEMPKEWYNVRADMKNKPAPLLNPATLKPMTAEELGDVFCEELVKQELDNDNRYIEIPQKIRDFYKMYRPAPLVRETIIA